MGAATPLEPFAAPSVPRHPKPVRRRTQWNDDSPSAMPRTSRHQGPPLHPQQNPSLNDRAVLHEYDAIPPPVSRDRGHQRRNTGSRPPMYSRSGMHVPAATATRVPDQPAMPLKSGSERSESHTEVSNDVIVANWTEWCFI